MKITNTTILKKGDIVKDDIWYTLVLETLGDLYFMSRVWEPTASKEEIASCKTILSCSNTLEYFINNNYELVTPEWSVDELKEGDKYWVVDISDDYGGVVHVNSRTYENNDFDKYYKKLGLIYATQEAGEARYKEIMK